MNFENHIVNKLLSSTNWRAEMIVATMQSDKSEDVERYGHLYDLLHPDDNKTYYVTNSVMDKLHLFDSKKCLKTEGWKIFSQLKDFKKTLILPTKDEQVCIRVMKKNGVLSFNHLSFKFHKKEERTRTEEGQAYWITLFVDLEENKLAEHFYSEDGKRIAPLLYALMCYIELCDNEEVIVKPKEKYGTKKTGNFINTFKLPIIVINNTWNVTTIRDEEFTVSGHVAIRMSGKGWSIPRLVYIEPYVKEGYVRKSGKQLNG